MDDETTGFVYGLRMKQLPKAVKRQTGKHNSVTRRARLPEQERRLDGQQALPSGQQLAIECSHAMGLNDGRDGGRRTASADTPGAILFTRS